MRMEKRFFLQLKFLHFVNNEGYNVQVPPKIYIVKLLFNHLMHKFSDSYADEDQFSTDKILLLWKDSREWKVYIPMKGSCSGIQQRTQN
jgi:hypothetical protein